jgi:hypothetical protein
MAPFVGGQTARIEQQNASKLLRGSGRSKSAARRGDSSWLVARHLTYDGLDLIGQSEFDGIVERILMAAAAAREPAQGQ